MLTPCGKNSGSMTADMKITVRSGTPRHSSMKAMEKDLTTTSSERRPSARRMPNGRAPGGGDEGDDDVEHQPSPLVGVNIGQAWHAADQQGAGERGKYGEQQKER